MAKLGLLRLAVVGGLLLAASAAAWGEIHGCGLGGAGQYWLCPPIHFGRPPGTEHVQQKKEAAKLRKLKKGRRKAAGFGGPVTHGNGPDAIAGPGRYYCNGPCCIHSNYIISMISRTYSVQEPNLPPSGRGWVALSTKGPLPGQGLRRRRPAGRRRSRAGRRIVGPAGAIGGGL